MLWFSINTSVTCHFLPSHLSQFIWHLPTTDGEGLHVLPLSHVKPVDVLILCHLLFTHFYMSSHMVGGEKWRTGERKSNREREKQHPFHPYSTEKFGPLPPNHGWLWHCWSADDAFLLHPLEPTVTSETQTVITWCILSSCRWANSGDEQTLWPHLWLVAANEDCPSWFIREGSIGCRTANKTHSFSNMKHPFQYMTHPLTQLMLMSLILP